MHGITTLFTLCVYEFVKYYPDTPSTKPHTSLTFPSSHMPNKRLALTPVMLRPMWGDNTKQTFSRLWGLSYMYALQHCSQGGWESLPRSGVIPTPSPTYPPPHSPLLPRLAKNLAEKGGGASWGRRCTDPPSCKPKWKARTLPKTTSEKNGLTHEVVKATLELHRCSNSFYLVNITSTAQEEAHERKCLFCN